MACILINNFNNLKGTIRFFASDDGFLNPADICARIGFSSERSRTLPLCLGKLSDYYNLWVFKVRFFIFFCLRGRFPFLYPEINSNSACHQSLFTVRAAEFEPRTTTQHYQ